MRVVTPTNILLSDHRGQGLPKLYSIAGRQLDLYLHAIHVYRSKYQSWIVGKTCPTLPFYCSFPPCGGNEEPYHISRLSKPTHHQSVKILITDGEGKRQDIRRRELKWKLLYSYTLLSKSSSRYLSVDCVNWSTCNTCISIFGQWERVHPWTA